MTIKEKLEEIADSKISTDRWVCVHNGYGDGRGMFLDDLRDGMALWKDEVLEPELTNYTFDNCEQLGNRKRKTQHG